MNLPLSIALKQNSAHFYKYRVSVFSDTVKGVWATLHETVLV